MSHRPGRALIVLALLLVPARAAVAQQTSVAVEALDEDERPVAGAVAEVRCTTEAGEHRSFTCTADRQGRCIIAAEIDGGCQLFARDARGRIGALHRMGPHGYQVVLARSGRIEGRVTGPDGAPIANATVYLLGRSGRAFGASPSPWQMISLVGNESQAANVAVGTATSGPDGRYVLETPGSGNVLVAACADGHTCAGAGPRQVLSGGRATMDLTIGRGVTLRGRVARADGSPAGPAYLRVQPAGSEDGMLVTEAAADGTFSFARVPEGPVLVSAVLFDGNVTVGPTLVRDASAPLDLRAPPVAELRVRIEVPRTDLAAGGPLHMFQIELTAEGAGERTRTFSTGGTLDATAKGSAAMTIPLGRYRALVRTPGRAKLLETFQLAAAGRSLVVQMGDDAHDLRGRVAFDATAPALATDEPPSFSVEVAPVDRRWFGHMVSPRADGTFSVSGLARGDYVVSAHALGRAADGRMVSGNASEVTAHDPARGGTPLQVVLATQLRSEPTGAEDPFCPLPFETGGRYDEATGRTTVLVETSAGRGRARLVAGDEIVRINGEEASGRGASIYYGRCGERVRLTVRRPATGATITTTVVRARPQ